MARNQEFSKRDINASLILSYNFSYFPNNMYIAYNFGLVGQNFRQSGISTNNIIRAITLHGANSFMPLFFLLLLHVNLPSNNTKNYISKKIDNSQSN